MGKKNKKRVDPAKKAALQARKDAKAEKVAAKRQNKEIDSDDDQDGESSRNGEDDDLDKLLLQYQQADQEIASTQHRLLDSFPSPRANATFTLAEIATKNKNEAYLFGGEYFNGSETVVSNQFFVCNLQKQKWTEIVSPHAPPPRCAHSAVYYNHAIYIFGGETYQHKRSSKDSSDYTHLRDLWKFSIPEQRWTEIPITDHAPSARSGHGAVLWKHYLIVVFGFQDTSSNTTKFLDDVKIMNLQTETWIHIHHSKLSLRPEPRSAPNLCIVQQDKLLIHGGFSKLTSKDQSETKVHTDSWLLHLSPILTDGGQPKWERLTTSVLQSQILPLSPESRQTPHGRSGTTAIGWKDRMLCFGGVLDKEQFNHKMDSIFYNDLFVFDVPKRKWYPAGPPKQNDGWDLHTLRSNMFAFVDANGNTVYEKDAGRTKPKRGSNAKQQPNQDDEDSDEEEYAGSGMQAVQNSSVMAVDPKTNRPVPIQRSDPLPRINAEMILCGATLYLYGGILEIGDREVTLDDMWSFDVKKRAPWECLYQGTMHKQVWKGAVFDDDDSYYSTGAENEKETGNDSDDSETESEKEPELTLSDLKDEIKRLIKAYDINDDEKTPRPGENLQDFYTRTKTHWSTSDAETDSDKVDAQSFSKAKERYDDLEPILQRIQSLDRKRKAAKRKG